MILTRLAPSLLFPALLLLLLGSLFLALGVGSVELSREEIWQALSQPNEGLAAQLLWELRLPRALNAIAVGALLALAGALMQVLLRNPLADPYILGISGGAAVAALVALLLGLGGWLLNGLAFAGALGSIMLVFGLAHGRGSWNTQRLLLTGVILASGWGATISFLLATAPAAQLPGMLFWLMGDLAYARHPAPGLWVALLALLCTLPMARSLNLLARGEQTAAALGVEVAQLRLAVFFLASLLTAVAVTIAGSIGFVGLVVPHLLRLLVGNDQRILLPASALFGASLLLLADTLSRTLIAPQQLPVGVLTAFIGVPLFLYLLQRGRL